MSGEFSPTTEQVRDGYAIDPEAEYRDPLTNHTPQGQRAFDRWLKGHDAEVKESVANLVCSQFSSELPYTGAEVIGRIRGIVHALEPHEADVKCLVCENDPGDDVGTGMDVIRMAFEAGARHFISGIEGSSDADRIETAWTAFMVEVQS